VADAGGIVIFGMGYGIATVVFNPRVLRAFGAKGPSMVSLLNAMFAVGAIVAPLGFVARVEPAGGLCRGGGLCALIWLAAGTGERVGGGGAGWPFRNPIGSDGAVCALA
jgi:MFS transporter, FHS family, glucose/mannose:H+ symporter